SLRSRSASASFILFLCPLICPLLFNDPPSTEIYTLSLHDALPIYPWRALGMVSMGAGVGFSLRFAWLLSERSNHAWFRAALLGRSEEHTSELQSRFDLVCRLLLEKKKKNTILVKRRSPTTHQSMKA